MDGDAGASTENSSFINVIGSFGAKTISKKPRKNVNKIRNRCFPANCLAPKRLMTCSLYSITCIRTPPSASPHTKDFINTSTVHNSPPPRTPSKVYRLNHTMEADNQGSTQQAVHSRSRSPGNHSIYQPPLKRCKRPRWCDIVERRSLINGIEENTHRVAQRQKQIDYGKNTIAYDRFNAVCPREFRKRGDPMTPLAKQKCSKRSFAGQITSWKKLVYAYVAKIDAKQNANESEENNPSVSGLDAAADMPGKESVANELKVEAETAASNIEIENKPPPPPDWDEECELSDFDDIELDDYGNVVEKPQTSPSPEQSTHEPSKSDESPASIFDAF